MFWHPMSSESCAAVAHSLPFFFICSQQMGYIVLYYRADAVGIITRSWAHDLVKRAALLITLGVRAARAMWFALFFLLFMIPLPGFVVDAATGPLKQYISVIAEQVLYAAGYPIARNGVMLTIGQYQLLVADACSGLHSMFSLSAMGLLYLYLMQRTSTARNLIIMAAILPLAFAANIVRVMVLILVTYHLGDEAGQGFLHDFAGIMLFVIGLLFLFALDGVLGFIFPDRPRAKAQA